jgi:putative hydrolase of the HAD superfamily
VGAYRELCAKAQREPSSEVARRIWDAASVVFETSAPLAEGAHESLERLGAAYDLALLTKGDPRVQEKRIADSGLRPFFERVLIVPDKGVREFEAMLGAAGRRAESAWSVGNSLPSDVNPALQCGMSAIWVDAHVWEHERREVTPREGTLLVASTLTEATNLLLSDRRAA